MAHFYDIDVNKVRATPITQFNKARAAMNILKAREYKMRMAISDYPNSKPHRRKELFDIVNEASTVQSEKKILTMDELMEAVSGR